MQHFTSSQWLLPPPPYTVVIPGHKFVVLVEQKKDVAMAARNGSGWRRAAKLHDWLAPNRSAYNL